MFTSPSIITDVDSNPNPSTDAPRPLEQATLLIRGTKVYWLDNGSRRELLSGDSVEVHGRAVVVLKQKTNAIKHAPVLHITFQFSSCDRVVVTLLRERNTVRLDSCRRSELLAELAGRRLRDRALGKTPSEEGWTDKLRLSKSLDVSPPYASTLLSRLRLLCPPLGFEPGSSLVETRSAMPGATSRAEQVRIATSHVRST